MRSLFVFYGIFAVIGIISLLVSVYFLFSGIQKSSQWIDAQGTVTDIRMDKSSRFPTVKFSYHDSTYTFNSSFSDDDAEVGSAVTVFFPAMNPNDAEVKSFFSEWFGFIFSFLFGLGFATPGVYGLIKEFRKSGAKKELFTEGRGKKISATIIEVSKNTSFKVNNRSPYTIKARWTDSLLNTTQDYESEYIWDDPSPFTQGMKSIDVYVDELNPERYYVDITFLPGKQ